MVSHFMAAIYPLVRLIRRWRKPGQSQDAKPDAMSALRSEFTIVPVANSLLALMLRIEAAWAGLGNRLPFGTSRRPDDGAQ